MTGCRRLDDSEPVEADVVNDLRSYPSYRMRLVQARALIALVPLLNEMKQKLRRQSGSTESQEDRREQLARALAPFTQQYREAREIYQRAVIRNQDIMTREILFLLQLWKAGGRYICSEKAIDQHV